VDGHKDSQQGGAVAWLAGFSQEMIITVQSWLMLERVTSIAVEKGRGLAKRPAPFWDAGRCQY
jgi:hypothetical protein